MRKFGSSLRRIIAYIIDILILFLVLAPLAFLLESLLGIQPDTAQEVWIAAVLSFSIPAWAYFIISDLSERGATLGKRIMRIHVQAENAIGLTFGRALLRNAVKLLPWELAHIFAFALADTFGEAIQLIGLTLSNLLLIIYFVVLVWNEGSKTVHDYLVKTIVRQDS